MSVTLDDLIESLQADVPARDSVPSAEQYERLVKEAVRDFSRRCGLKRRSTLSVTAGTATYSLEADFMKMIRLAGLTAQQGVIITDKIIPVPIGFKETYIIGQGQITFYPTPTYTLERAYEYKGAWILTIDDYLGDIYELMGDEEAEIALIKARALALGMQEVQVSATGSGFRYRIGDVEIDKSGASSSSATSQASSADLEKAYLAACESYNGNTGMALGGVW